MESNDCLQLRCGIKGLFKIIQDIRVLNSFDFLIYPSRSHKA